MQFLDRLKGALRGRQVSSSPDKLEAVPLDESAQAVRRKQMVIAGVLGVFLLLALMIYATSGNERAPVVQQGPSDEARFIENLTRGAAPERNWVDRSEERFKGLEKRIQQLEKENSDLRGEVKQGEEAEAVLTEDAVRTIDAQAEEIKRLEEALKQKNSASGNSVLPARRKLRHRSRPLLSQRSRHRSKPSRKLSSALFLQAAEAAESLQAGRLVLLQLRPLLFLC